MKSLKNMARDALDVQDACNLSGVVRSFVNVIDDVRAISPGNRDWCRHPIIKLWADKIASLTDTQGNWVSMTAYNAVEDIVKLPAQLEVA